MNQAESRVYELLLLVAKSGEPVGVAGMAERLGMREGAVRAALASLESERGLLFPVNEIEWAVVDRFRITATTMEIEGL